MSTKLTRAARAACLASILAASIPAALAQDIKIGVILGFTGPIESLTP
ncbi:MAG: branched-chain amino acid ABC transporter substrate-binding protein, partial [Gammaproteobacteria bacterium]|nr:branched-chain amino acid ABC transporter substrate-binding protein [Gammaproteobacteria bacterium]